MLVPPPGFDQLADLLDVGLAAHEPVRWGRKVVRWRRGAGRLGHQRAVLVDDLLLEFVQVGPGLEAHLGERVPDIAEDAQRF